MSAIVLNKQNNPQTGNPWKGLDFYKETDIIYGRDLETESLFEYIRHNTQVVLYGRSGIGKSSILNAGIFPRARQERMVPIAIKLSHSNSISYLDQIKDAIKKAEIEAFEVLPVVNTDQETLWEYFHRHQFFYEDSRVTLLVVFDQFEEIFTLQSDEQKRKDFFVELANLINNVMPHALVQQTSHITKKSVIYEQGKNINDNLNGIDLDIDLDISDETENQRDYLSNLSLRMVFTIREDFLSYLERYTAHIPPMRDNRYALLPLNEEQASEVILRPCPNLVDTAVAKLIIAKVTNNFDFELDGVPEIEVDAAVLSLYLSRLYEEMVKRGESKISVDLVEQAGTNIIQQFYDDCVNPLPVEKQVELEYQLLTGNDRRDNISRSDFLALGFTEADIHYLVEEVKLLRQFSMRDDLRLEFIHDILCPVVKERKEQRELQRQQEEERLRQEEEKRKLRAEAELKQKEFEERAAAEKAAMEAEANRIKKRNRNWIVSLTSFIIFLCLCIGIYYYCFITPYSEEYGNFTTRYGWPIGLGEQLSSKDKEKCTLYYKLTREGRLSSFMGTPRPFSKVQVLNWNGEPSTNAFMESPIVSIIEKELDDAKSAKFAKLLSLVSYWQYTSGANGVISVKTAFDINGNELYSENYSSSKGSERSSKYVLWSIFKDKDGNELQVSDKGTDRIRYTVSDGYITGCSFFTVLGTPQPNLKGDYGYSYEVDSINHNIVSQCSLDKFGEKLDSTHIHFTEFENGRFVKSDVCNVIYSNKNVIRQYSNHSDTIHIIHSGFVDYMSRYINESDRVCIRYKSEDCLQEKKIYSRDTISYCASYFYSSALDSVVIADFSKHLNYTEKYTYPKQNVVERTFWSNGEKILFPYKNDIDTIKCHKVVIETSVQKKEKTVTKSFYDCFNKLTKEGEYSKCMIITDVHSDNTLYEYYYNADNEICKSEMSTYNEYGIRESRSVAGIDGTPVRCPNWDWNGFAYYKMSLLRDFSDNCFVAIKGTNEFGESSYIVKYSSIFKIDELPLEKQEKIDNTNREDQYLSYGLQISRTIIDDKQEGELFNVPFLHILNKKGTLYNAVGIKRQCFMRDGLFDNDILCNVGNWSLGNSLECLDREWNKIESTGGQIQVLRVVNKEYSKLTFYVKPGRMNSEIHCLPVTNQELNKIKKYIQ